jgi:predicted CXXCH cytochrome family protein
MIACKLDPMIRVGAQRLGHPLTSVALLLALSLVWLVVPADAAITLLYPPSKTTISRSDHLIFRLNSLEYTGVKITINGVDSDVLPLGSPEYRRAFQDFVILQPLWDKGKNNITIEAFKGTQKEAVLSSAIFYAPKGEGVAVPAEYAVGSLHTSDIERQCVSCHNMAPTLAQVNTSVGKANPCYTCHKKILNAEFVHGPTGTFSCAYCHALQGEPKYATPKRDVALCGECHVERVAQFKAMKMRHGPVDAGMCELCHDPHGSGTIAQLKMPINKLCISCHEQVGTGIHVNRSTYGEGHPLSGKPDISPKGKGRELSCVSCHDPHGGNFRYYFQNNLEGRMDLCQYCHKK